MKAWVIKRDDGLYLTNCVIVFQESIFNKKEFPLIFENEDKAKLRMKELNLINCKVVKVEIREVVEE